jgi:competence protein ComEC
MRRSPIRYRLEKSRLARWVNRLRLQGIAVWVAATLMTTTAVQTGLLPLMIHHFHRFSAASPLANVAEAALISVLMVAGALFLIADSIVGPWASKFAWVVNKLGWLTVWAGKLAIAWPKASFRTPDFGAGWQWVFAAFFVAVLTLIVAVNEWNPFRKGDAVNDARRRLAGRAAAAGSILAIAAIGWLLIAHPFTHEFERDRLSVTFLDVGQGDSILISFPKGASMLLDSGGRAGFASRGSEDENEDVFVEDRIGIGEAAVMPYLWSRGIGRLDWIAASHGHPDHTGGFGEIVEGFEIGAALKGVTGHKESPHDLFTKAAAVSGAPLRIVRRGDTLVIDGVRIEALAPLAESGRAPMSDNNESMVLRLSYGGRSFLLTGDIEKEAESRLVQSGTDLRADVLKVAHHGSKTSSTTEFLEKVNPRHAVISVAKLSPFGHPHAETIARLRTMSACVWRTSECGAITISTDGTDLRVETFVKCESEGRSGDKASRSAPER